MSNLDASDVGNQWAALRISSAQHALDTINELARRWQHAKDGLPKSRQGDSFTMGRMEGYVQAIALTLMVPHAEVKDMLERGELPR